MDLTSRTVVAVFSLFGTLLSRQAANEFKAWTPWLIDCLIRRAANAYPPEFRERISEEYHSRVFDTPGELGKLIVAIRLQWNEDNSKIISLDQVFGAIGLFAIFPCFLMIALAVFICGGRPILV